MENSTVVVLMIGAAIWALGSVELLQRWRKKRERPVKIEAGALAVMIEHQARMDMQCLAIRLLINTHPQAHQLKGVIRATAPQYVKAYCGDAPDAADMYGCAIEEALDALLMD